MGLCRKWPTNKWPGPGFQEKNTWKLGDTGKLNVCFLAMKLIVDTFLLTFFFWMKFKRTSDMLQEQSREVGMSRQLLEQQKSQFPGNVSGTKGVAPGRRTKTKQKHKSKQKSKQKAAWG